MEDIINIKDATDIQFLERFKRLEDIIPESMNDVVKNPFIQYIKECGEVSVAMVDFFYHSDFLERLTPKLLLISKKLYDKKADTKWYQAMLFIIEEKEDAETFCENIPLYAAMNIEYEVVREVIESSYSATEMIKALSAYTKKEYNESVCDEDENIKNNFVVSKLLITIEELEQEKMELSNDFEKVIQKYDKEKEILLVQVKQLENSVESFKRDRENDERQFQNVLENRQNLYNRLIEEKRITLKYKLQVERLQKQITDISQMREEQEKFKNLVTGLEEDKEELQHKVEELLVKVENLNTINNEKNFMITEVNNSLIEKENEIVLLQSKINNLEEKLENTDIGNSFNATVPLETTNISYGNEILIQEKSFVQEVGQNNEFPNSHIITVENGLQSVKRKSNWFTNLIAQHSKKAFLKNSRQDQETMIFIKMMEMRYPTEKIKKIKKSLSENIPCFELYKLICMEPSLEELEEFFNKYVQADSVFA